MYTVDEILEAARSIRLQLSRLLGPEAAVVDRTLSELLSSSERGERVDNLILELLSRYEPTRSWMLNFLQTRARWAENQEREIERCRKALKSLSRQGAPVEWVYTMLRLAFAYQNRALVGQAENQERAIESYHRALEALNELGSHAAGASAFMNLGILYLDRIQGERAENVELAIGSLRQALEVFSRQSTPIEWAHTMVNLAFAYQNRVRGYRAENLDFAIAGYQRALELLHEETSPAEWARAVANLAFVYQNRVRGDRAESLERAIEMYGRALEVFSRREMPLEWATTKMNLASVFLERIRGDKSENQVQAYRAYQEALEILAPSSYAESRAQIDELVQSMTPQSRAWMEELMRRMMMDRQQMVTDSAAGAAQVSEAWERVLEGTTRHYRGPEETPAPPRYVNLCLVKRGNEAVVPKERSLSVDTLYYLRVSIGSWSTENVIENALASRFPVEFLPQTETGHWLEVVAVSDEFTLDRSRYDVFLPNVGPSWVCQCTPKGKHLCSEDSRQAYLFIPLHSPKESGIAHLRIGIYFELNLVQSFILRAEILPTERTANGYSASMDYSLTSTLSRIDVLPSRSLHILVNETSDGTHKFVINGRLEDAVTFNLTEGQVRKSMEAVRDMLRTLHVEEYGGKLGSLAHIRNLYDVNNRKPKSEFIADLNKLAPLGWLLWTTLLQARPEVRRKLQEDLLREPASIQVSRVAGSTFVFPWSLVYDIPIESDSKHYVSCKLLEEWDSQLVQAHESEPRCPFEKTHVKNTICPFGFWGFRHTIEQPPSMPLGRELPLLIRVGNRPPALVAALSLELDEDLTNAHLQAISKKLCQFSLLKEDSRTAIAKALAGPKLEILYFYCHGRREALAGTGIQIPYLGVGKREGISPTDITSWDVSDWDRDHWRETSPLVFINGCHTAEISPESLVNFVDAFVGAYAAGVIGTEVLIHQQVASEAAEEFFLGFQANKTVGEALRQMRLHFLVKGNLMGLAYTPYCSTNLRLSPSAN